MGKGPKKIKHSLTFKMLEEMCKKHGKAYLDKLKVELENDPLVPKPGFSAGNYYLSDSGLYVPASQGYPPVSPAPCGGVNQEAKTHEVKLALFAAFQQPLACAETRRIGDNHAAAFAQLARDRGYRDRTGDK